MMNTFNYFAKSTTFGFPLEVWELLQEYTVMPVERANKIADSVKQKIEYLRIFQEGKKIWKKKSIGKVSYTSVL